MAEITVIGSFVMDSVAVMSRFPIDGETVSGNSIAFYPGGKGANQCVSIARLGGDVEMCGMLGKDDNGKRFIGILEKEGIKHDHVFFCDVSTAVAQIQIDGKGENRICVIPSANYKFGMEAVEKIDGLIRKTELIVLQLELPLETVCEIIRRAKKYGTMILLNPAPAVKLNDDILAGIDYLTPNEHELTTLTGLPVNSLDEIEHACKFLHCKGIKNVITTLGPRGAFVVNDHLCELVAGYKVKAVDTVGAGDSFNGALAVKITERSGLKDAIRFANAMGALTVQIKGAIPSLHYKKEVNEFLEEQNL